MEKLLYVVGIGPGDRRYMTFEAVDVLQKSEVIVGYTVYVDLVKEYFPQAEFLTTPMKQEKERCVLALEKADEGKITSVVCSGDSSVYGMAGLILMLAEDYPEVEVKIVSGITAAISGGAVLGAPLGHDFCVISLSDLLTPMDKIEKRLACAAMGDFIICLYNPSSKKRADYLQKACDIILQYQSPETVCGIVKNIGRDGETMELMSLAELRDTAVDMFTTVFIGNSETIMCGGRMVTPRGYRNV